MKSTLIEKIKVVLSNNGISFRELNLVAIYANPHHRGRITFLVYEQSRKLPRYVVKVSRSNKSRLALDQEQENLQRCIAQNTFLQQSINRYFWSDEDIALVLEPYINGSSIHESRDVQSYSEKVLDWLIQLQQASCGPIWKNKDLFLFTESLIEDVNHYYEISHQIQSLFSELKGRLQNIPEFAINATVVHGDLTISNLKLHEQIVEVFDWEWIQEANWPFLDLWTFLFSLAGDIKYSNNYIASGSNISKTLLGANSFSGMILELIHVYNMRQKYPMDLIQYFALLTLLDITRRDHLVNEINHGRSDRFFKVIKDISGQTENLWSYLNSI